MAKTKREAVRVTITAPLKPLFILAPQARKIRIRITAFPAAITAAHPSRPKRIGTRDTGETPSRSKKPSSMSKARAVPALVAPNETA